MESLKICICIGSTENWSNYLQRKGTEAEIEETAKMLAHESGGILVGIVPTSKGQAIIVYRGKNYQRPPRLRPENLLTKREA
ncbi:hypothetical protein O6H91_04G080000 [Diphasiastrum complanatum]|uniref:Uncharacterized protein n=1 Tax=Diphasiastrum complanatum TaxID=34168 RepID=A0ACC2DYM2_DIPCM|nr:hypothetical protein O6H91_04G080000 [Diphasiastrum complanatum]